jgi:probable HAF family extracellular repeat protein
MKPSTAIAVVALLIPVFAGTAGAQTYSVTDLGVLPGDTAGEGLFITNNQAIVGCSDTSTIASLPCTTQSPGHAFLWTSSQGLQDLGTLPGGNYSVGNGANDAGQVVGYSDGPQNGHAFLWTQAGGMQDLGTLPGGSASWAVGNNEAGWVLGYSDYANSNGKLNLAVWDPTGNAHDLGSLPKGLFTAGEGLSQGDVINGNGYIVGVSYVSFNPVIFHAIYWTRETGVKEFTGLNSSALSEATSVNSKGIASGWSSTSGVYGSRALLWDRSGRFHDLGTIPGWQSTAYFINDRNQVVGFLNTLTQSHAMYWTAEGGMQDLNDLIPSDSGWLLGAAIGINNEGAITGYGSINGENHGFLLTPLEDQSVTARGSLPKSAQPTGPDPGSEAFRHIQSVNPRLMIQNRGD